MPLVSWLSYQSLSSTRTEATNLYHLGTAYLPTLEGIKVENPKIYYYFFYLLFFRLAGNLGLIINWDDKISALVEFHGNYL